MDEKKQQLLCALHAILFIYGEEISVGRLAKALGTEKETVQELIASLREELSRESQGLMLLEAGDGIQLVTKPELAPYLEEFTKEEFQEELSKASLETLAIIAYLGPISRAEIDYIRGVNSTFILRSLLLRKLIDRAPSVERPGILVYEVSGDAMRHLGLVRREQLPDFEKYRELLNFIKKRDEQ